MAKLLIDGDILIYRACAAVEQEVEFDDVHILHSKFGDALANYIEQLHDLFEQAETEECVIAISDKQNWRKDICSYYKANRANVRKPLVFSRLRQYVIDNSDSIIMPRLEADDVLGILATEHPDDYIIWSLDKDLMQVPGLHLVDDEVITVTPEEGERFWKYQTLVGDTADNYKGAPGIGPVKANKILGMSDTWGSVAVAFKGDTEAYEINKAVSRILQAGEYNPDTYEVTHERRFI